MDTQIISIGRYFTFKLYRNVIDNYVCRSIARNKATGEFDFVTSDEDYTVKYWQNGVNVGTFKLPAQSVWSVACLNNGDIVTGTRFATLHLRSLKNEKCMLFVVMV